mgnify:CR=1 FL=1
MKKLIFIILLSTRAIPAGAQYMPCIYQPPSQFRPGMAVYLPDGKGGFSWQVPPQPEPVVVDAFEQVYKLNAGAWWTVTFFIPVAGRCVGSFNAYDDRSDNYKTVMDAAGRYVSVPVRAAGEVEIIVIGDHEMARIKGAISTQSYRAAYSTGRTFGGTIDGSLQPGWYHLVIYNGFSNAAKSVDLKFGGKLPDRKP